MWLTIFLLYPPLWFVGLSLEIINIIKSEMIYDEINETEKITVSWRGLIFRTRR